jgi:hypothetical protein
MWTWSAQLPFGRRSTQTASSKSRAVSPSMVTMGSREIAAALDIGLGDCGGHGLRLLDDLGRELVAGGARMTISRPRRNRQGGRNSIARPTARAPLGILSSSTLTTMPFSSATFATLGAITPMRSQRARRGGSSRPSGISIH